MWIMSGLLGLAPVLLAPSMAAAIFPPVYHDPAVTVAPTVVVAPTVTTTPITPSIPATPTVTTTAVAPTVTPVASTPEPASIVTGVAGLLAAFGLIRRRRGGSPTADFPTK
jgi:MYXO-CTERM domain-containing protein